MSMIRRLMAVMMMAALILCGAAAAEETPLPQEAEAFEGIWACDRATAALYWEEEGFKVLITWGSSAWEETEWEYSCLYHAEDNTVVSMPFGIRREVVYNDEGEIASVTEAYSDGEAVFSLDAEGFLLWQDLKENAGEGMRFEKMPDGDEENMMPADESSEAGEQAGDASMEESFYIAPISDELFSRIYGKSFKEDCTLSRDDLRYLHVLHVDLDGAEHEGEMIVNYHIAEDVLEILRQLYEAKYPIEKIRLVDEYDADDELSMEDNNSSAFNFRFISHTTRVSKHGLGLAVDINTLYNPYTKIVDGTRIVEPITGEPYLDREADFPYKIDHEDLCFRLFTEHGFEWGGDWEDRKDYQHFEIPTDVIAEWYPENQ